MNSQELLRALKGEDEDIEVTTKRATLHDRLSWLRITWQIWREEEDPEVRAGARKGFWLILRYCLKPNAQAHFLRER